MDQINHLISALHSSPLFQLLRALRLVGQLVEFGQEWELWLALAAPAQGRQFEVLMEAIQRPGREKTTLAYTLTTAVAGQSGHREQATGN